MDPEKLWLRLAGSVFGIVGLLHLLRIVTRVPVMIGDWLMPYWFNWTGLTGALFLSIILWNQSLKKSK